MREFKAFFLLESKRFFFNPRNAVIFLLLYVSALLFVQVGVNQIHQSIQLKQKFQEIEKEKVNQYITYTQYGGYGIRVLFFPDQISLLFFNTGVIKDMTAYVDSGERLRIYLPLKGKNVFSLANKGFTDFSGVILFFGSLLALLFGFDSLINEEYLKFLSSLTRANHVFLSLLLARLLLVFLLFLLLFCFALVLIYLNGICLQVNLNFLYFFLVIVLNSFFFFALGMVFGTFKSKITGFVYAISGWFLLIFIFPGALNAYIEGKAADITPVYQLEMEKLKIVMEFEKRAIEKAGILEYGKEVSDLDRKLMKDFLNKDFKKILLLEEKLTDQMRKHTSLFQILSNFFPSSFYLSVNNEIGSRGYENLLDFYRRVLELKRKFVKFIIDKIYFENFSEVVPFIKGEENVYHARSRIPNYFWQGIMITLFHISYLLGISFFRFKKALYQLPDVKINTQQATRVKLARKDFKVWTTINEMFKKQLYNLFSGINKRPAKNKTIPPLEVVIDNLPLSPGDKKQDFLYLCRLCHFPNDVKAADFLSFLDALMNTPANTAESPTPPWTRNKIKQLDNHEMGQLAIRILERKPFDIYLIDNITRGMPGEFVIQLKEKMEELKTGGLVFFIDKDNTDMSFWKIKDNPSRYFWEDHLWTRQVDTLKEA